MRRQTQLVNIRPTLSAHQDPSTFCSKNRDAAYFAIMYFSNSDYLPTKLIIDLDQVRSSSARFFKQIKIALYKLSDARERTRCKIVAAILNFGGLVDAPVFHA